MNILIIGPQGSGKGSQGKMIANEFNLKFISTGDLYREEVKLGTDIGILAKPVITKGDLMSDEITRYLVEERLSKTDLSNGIIIDGYPRNIHQANDLDQIIKIDYLIMLEVPKEITIKRISNRRGCKNGHIYNLISKPPKVDGVCDQDGEKLFTRSDDKPKYIKRRLEIYEKETTPVIDYYKKQGKLLVFDASAGLQEVYEEIFKRLKAIL